MILILNQNYGSLLDKQTDRWQVSGFGDNVYKEMFNNSTLLYFYINDEIYKVHRLIYYAGDFRSACLKAASISEILMRMRLWIISDAVRIEGPSKFSKDIEIPSMENEFNNIGI